MFCHVCRPHLQTLHVGDRFTLSGNDTATRDVCSVLWVANPEEVRRHPVGVARVSVHGPGPWLSCALCSVLRCFLEFHKPRKRIWVWSRGARHRLHPCTAYPSCAERFGFVPRMYCSCHRPASSSRCCSRTSARAGGSRTLSESCHSHGVPLGCYSSTTGWVRL